MGPPKYGTPQYSEYLRLQRERRQKKRDAAAESRVLNKPVVRKLVSKLKHEASTSQKELERVSSRSNVHFRALAKAKASDKHSRKLAFDCGWEMQRLTREHAKQLAQKEKEFEQKLAEKDKTLKSQAAVLAQWEAWAGRVQAKASPSTWKFFRKEFLYPSYAKDSCWGGGQ